MNFKRPLSFLVLVAYMNLMCLSTIAHAAEPTPSLPTPSLPTNTATFSYSFTAPDPNYERRLEEEAKARRAEQERLEREAKERRQAQKEANAEVRLDCQKAHGVYRTHDGEDGPVGYCATDVSDGGFTWKPKHTVLTAAIFAIAGVVTYGFYSHSHDVEWQNQ